MGKTLGRGAKSLGMLMALALVLLAVGCGKDGKIYGYMEWDGVVQLGSYVEGFPSYVYPDQYYEVKSGTHAVVYQLYYNSLYYPSPTTYFQFTYTVEADSGSFPFVDGKDHHFGLYLGYDWMYITGDVKGLPTQRGAAGSKAGTRTWTEDGLKITVTGSVVNLTPDQVSKLPKMKFGN